MDDLGDNIEAQLVCRACLRIVEYKAQSYGHIEDPNGSLKDMIMCCVPEMDIYVSSDPIMCLPCIQVIVNLYNFKNRCINTESIIRSYIQRNNLEEYSHVNLNCVVKDLIQINRFHKEQQDRIMAMRAALESYNEHSVRPHFLVPSNTPPPIGDMPQLSFFPRHFLSNYIEPPPLHPISEPGNVFAMQESPFAACSELVASQESEVQLQQANITSSEECQREELVAAKKDLGSENSYVSPIESKLRLVVKIPRSQITIPLEASKDGVEDKNEDSSEKENRQEEMEIPEISHMEEEPTDSDQSFKFSEKYDDINKIYNCSCMYLTTSEALFIEHKKKCRNRSNNLLKCPHCLHVTNRPYALSKHINTMHTKAVWFVCEYCTYRSTAKECLRRHIRKNHSDNVDISADHACQICGQKCTSEFNLSKHMLKHAATLLSCVFCSYTSKDRSNFRKHIFTHNTKPLVCHVCGYTNVSPYQMRIHLKQRHGGVGVEMVDCRSDRPVSEIINDIKVSLMEEKGLIDEYMG
ncbi:unnamed protein product [Phaedon cochleariae]|uniref:C2H2-type domain-containing protein n=1 Tax=Phaedon cochleariae TaxID=80249 RepID=A0A9P0DAC6_PHACE|nr:unnamed protein product [Phaedon cochleariae]